MIPLPPKEFGRKEWLGRMRVPSAPTVDYELGGVELNDTSQGLASHQWEARYKSGGVYIRRLDREDEELIFSHGPMQRLGLAFDQNMSPVLVWTDDTGTHLRYFGTEGAFVVIDVPGAAHPAITLDERRFEFLFDSDVVLCYIRDGELRCRVQRENYGVEHLLVAEPDGTNLAQFGMTRETRLQWRII